MKKIAGLTLGVMTGMAALLGSTTSSTAEAFPAGGPARHINQCRSTPADATVEWGANQVTVSADSPAMTYGHGGCPAYVTDFKVTHATANVSGIQQAYSPNFTFSGLDPARIGPMGSVYINSRGQCPTYQIQILVYKQTGGQGTPAFVGGGWMRGAWQTGFPWGAQGACALVPEQGYVAVPQFAPPASGTDVYRVAVEAEIANPNVVTAHVGAVGQHLIAFQ